MENEIVKVEKHDRVMSVQAGLVGLHRDHCLCWQGCANFKPDDPDVNCPVAQSLFEFDVKYGVTTPVWECETYEGADSE